jgi:hypothetical protein
MRLNFLPGVFAGLVVTAACGGSAPRDGGLDPHVFAVCGSFKNPNLPPSTSAAGGTFSSPLLDAVMCPGAASAHIIPNMPSLMSVVCAPYFFLLTSPRPAGWGAPATTGFVVQSPSDTVSIELNVEVALPAPMPGTYEGGCGDVTTDLFYGPGPSQDGWVAATGTNCGDGWWTPRGNWKLYLTSVTEQDVSPGQAAYVPHGTFTGTMPDYYFDNGTGPLSVSFVF